MRDDRINSFQNDFKKNEVLNFKLVKTWKSESVECEENRPTT